MARTKLIAAAAASSSAPRYNRYIAQLIQAGGELTPNGNVIVNVDEIAIGTPCPSTTRTGMPCKSHCQTGYNFCFRHK